jgi:hypothetical protein
MQHGDTDLALKEKDEEIEVYKSGMEQALMELEELRLVRMTTVELVSPSSPHEADGS